MSYLIAAAVFGAIFCYSALWLFQQWKLAREGVITRAKIIKKLQPFGPFKGPVTGLIKYNFLTPRGQYVEQSVLVGEAVCHLHEEGSEIEVLYCKDKPQITGTKVRVNASREFLRMSAL